MLKTGDRITGTFNDGRPDVVSGIVAHSVDLGRADFAVLIWAGVNGGRMAFEAYVVNLFEVEVVERVCAFPAIPQVMLNVLSRCVQQAAKEVDGDVPEVAAEIDKLTAEMKAFFIGNNVGKAMRLAATALRGKCTAAAARTSIIDTLVIPPIRAQPRRYPHNREIAIRSAMYVASLQLLDEAMAAVAAEVDRG